MAQLSNRVQHGLRAYTPAEQKAVKAAAEAFRANPNFKSEDAIMELGTGEALVSFLDADGKPSIVENAKVLPPQCLMAAASDEAKSAVIQGQVSLMAKYGDAIDRESAFEMIQDEREQNAAVEELARERAEFEAQKAEFAKLTCVTLDGWIGWRKKKTQPTKVGRWLRGSELRNQRPVNLA